MNLTINYKDFDLSLFEQFDKINLILPNRKMDKKDIIYITRLMNQKENITLTLTEIKPYIDLLYNIPIKSRINITVNPEYDREVINYCKLLIKYNVSLKIIGSWNFTTLKTIKKLSHLRYNVIVYFENIKNIDQETFENLFQFVYFNTLRFNIIEPFKSILSSFLNPLSNTNLFEIYNEIPGFSFYNENNLLSLGPLWNSKKKYIGKFNSEPDLIKTNMFFEEIKKNYNKEFPDNSKCLKCEYKKFCAGYILNLYDNCPNEWKEIFNTIKDISRILISNLY